MNHETEEWVRQSVRVDVPGIPAPPFSKAITERSNLPELPPEQIGGLLRRGAMMLLQGASKMGKSFALIELAIALAFGGEWLGFQCEKCRVLYINLEIQPASFFWRVHAVAKAMSSDMPAIQENLTIWNARGENLTIEQIKDKFTQWQLYGKFDVIVIDPLYKVQPGNENDAEAINRFFNAIDAIAQENNASMIMCHHHSKGGQLKKAAIDRSSGSGVFGRAADLIVDFTEFPQNGISFEAKREACVSDGAVPLWVSFIVRDFKSPESFGAWFQYPIHERDTTGLLSNEALRSSHNTEHATKMQEEIDAKIAELMGGRGSITRKELEDATGKDKKTLNKYIQGSLLFESETVNNNTVQIKRRG